MTRGKAEEGLFFKGIVGNYQGALKKAFPKATKKQRGKVKGILELSTTRGYESILTGIPFTKVKKVRRKKKR